MHMRGSYVRSDQTGLRPGLRRRTHLDLAQRVGAREQKLTEIIRDCRCRL